MAHLTRHQSSISKSIRYGQRLSTLAERLQRSEASLDRPATEDNKDSDDEGMNNDPPSILRSVRVDEVVRMTALLHERWNHLNKAAGATNQFLASCLLKRQEALLKAVELFLGQLEWEK